MSKGGRVTTDQAAEIRLRRRCGESTKSVAKIMGLCAASIWNWQDLPRQRWPQGSGHDPVKLRAKYKRRYWRDHAKNVLRRKLSAYKMTEQEWDDLFAADNNRCAICHSMSRLQVDHDHVTKKLRGILCSRCNRAIGLLGDSIAGLERAVAYLRR